MGERPWDTNNALLVQIFCAAITGIVANKWFDGPLMQGSPDAAVEFADRVVVAAGGGRRAVQTANDGSDGT